MTRTEREGRWQATASQNRQQPDEHTTSPLRTQPPLIVAPASQPRDRDEATAKAMQHEAAVRRMVALATDERGATSLQLIALAGHYAARARGLWMAAEAFA